MSQDPETIRALYSFPHRIGAARICTTAWYQVDGVAAAGGKVAAHPGAVARPLSPAIEVRPTLARGSMRVPYRALGRYRALHVHDRIVARRLPALANSIDVVHVWPLGAMHTVRAARRLGIPTVLERPNAHTRFAYRVVAEESRRLGVELPPGHEHSFQAEVLAYEEEEYELADYLLCPSDFVVKTFIDEGFPADKLLRHAYGYDPAIFTPGAEDSHVGVRALFVGVAAVRKGLHFALEAWRRSPASTDGTFSIAGEFLPSYRELLEPLLDHPSIRVLGHRRDVPDLMRSNDVLILPSIEEGSPLVCAEAIGSGCVPLVSDVCAEGCTHDVNALVHPVGDVDALTAQLTRLHEDPRLLRRLRAGVVASAPGVTWGRAGVTLLDAYRTAVRLGPTEAGARSEVPRLRAR